MLRFKGKLTNIYNFLESLVSQKNVVIDTGWYKNWDSAEIALPQFGDSSDTLVKFPFKDILISYNTLSWNNDKQPKYFFMVNNHKLADSVGNSDNDFSRSIYKIDYMGSKYLIFTGNQRHFNGSGDRININYFVDLSDSNVVMDIYKNAWGYTSYPLLYGDLNNDEKLDRVKFDGIWMAIDIVCVIHINAETYQSKKWQPLKDKNGQPYFIELYCDSDMKNLKLKKVHWMNPILSDE